MSKYLLNVSNIYNDAMQASIITLRHTNIHDHNIGNINNIQQRINVSNIDDDVQVEHINNHHDDGTIYKVELDSHANMPVVGIGAYIISKTGKTADVNSYNPQNGTLQIPIVDAAVQYDDP